MTFSFHQKGVVMSSEITHIIINIHSLAQTLDICALICSSCAFFSSSHPSPGKNHQSRAVRKNTGPSKNAQLKLIQLHMYIHPHNPKHRHILNGLSGIIYSKKGWRIHTYSINIRAFNPVYKYRFIDFLNY